MSVAIHRRCGVAEAQFQRREQSDNDERAHHRSVCVGSTDLKARRRRFDSLRLSQLHGAVYRAPDSQPSEDARSAPPTNPGNAAGRQSDEQGNGSNGDLSDLAAKRRENLTVQTNTSEYPQYIRVGIVAAQRSGCLTIPLATTGLPPSTERNRSGSCAQSGIDDRITLFVLASVIAIP